MDYARLTQQRQRDAQYPPWWRLPAGGKIVAQVAAVAIILLASGIGLIISLAVLLR